MKLIRSWLDFNSLEWWRVKTHKVDLIIIVFLKAFARISDIESNQKELLERVLHFHDGRRKSMKNQNEISKPLYKDAIYSFFSPLHFTWRKTFSKAQKDAVRWGKLKKIGIICMLGLRRLEVTNGLLSALVRSEGN